MTYLLNFVQKMTSHSLFCCCPTWFEQLLTELNASKAIANMYSYQKKNPFTIKSLKYSVT